MALSYLSQVKSYETEVAGRFQKVALMRKMTAKDTETLTLFLLFGLCFLSRRTNFVSA